MTRKRQDHPVVSAEPAHALRRALSPRLAAGVIVAAGLVVYANSLRGSFVFDDVRGIVENASLVHVDRPGNAAHYIMSAMRPLVNVTFLLNYILGNQAWAYHAINVAIHLLAALAMFGVVRRTLSGPLLAARFGPAAVPLAMTATLIWTVHPLCTQAVTYISQRGEAMVGLLYLLTLYCVIRARQDESPVAPHLWHSGVVATPRTHLVTDQQCADRSVRRWHVLAVVCCALGMATKQVMVTAPLMVLLYDWVFFRGSVVRVLRRSWGLYAGLAGSLIVLACLVFTQSAGTTAGFGVRRFGPLQYAMTQPGVIAHYLALSVWPGQLCIDYAWPVANTVQDVILPGLLILSLLGLTTWALRRHRAWGFVGAWFFVILAPTSSIMPILDVAVEHRMYLPLAAVVIAAVMGGYLLLRRFGGPLVKAPAAAVLVAAIIVALGVRTIVRNEDYRSDLAMWELVVAAVPHNGRAHLNMGVARAAVPGQEERSAREIKLGHEMRGEWAEVACDQAEEEARRGRLDAAVAEYTRAIQSDPSMLRAYTGRACAFNDLGRYAQAAADCRKALELQSDCYQAWNTLAIAQTRLGQHELALRSVQRSLEIRGDYVEALNTRGNIYISTNMLSDAISCFARAIELAPHRAMGYGNRGVALALMGQHGLAIEDFSKAIELDARWTEARTNRARSYVAVARYDLAINDLTAAIEIRPDQPTAYGLRGALRAKQRQYAAAREDLEACTRLGGQCDPRIVALVNANTASQPASREAGR